jgi:hypothetical protein
MRPFQSGRISTLLGADPKAPEEAPPETEPGGAVVASACSGSSVRVAAAHP